MHCRNRKLSVGQGACLVENHCANLGQHVHVIGTFHENAFAGRATDATKESERHTDDQGTRTRHHKEHQGTIKPSGKGATEIAREQRRQQCQSDGRKNHNRRIDTRKL